MITYLSQKFPYAITRRIRIEKRNRLINRYRRPEITGAFEGVLSSVDVPRIDRLWDEVKPAFLAHQACAAKYCDYDVWLRLNIYRAAKLALDQREPMTLLDIGCGSGYFLRVARYFGHQSFGCDAPSSVLTPIERKVFPEMLSALRVKDYTWDSFIQPFVPINLDRKYDMITAFWVCFNNHLGDNEWGAREWEFFMQDILQYLNPGGAFYMELNENPARYGKLLWYDQETLRAFQRLGTVEKNIITVVKR